MLEIDVTMTATRRPELVARTLQSFEKRLFRHVRVRRLFLNIDPLWGSVADAAEIERMALQYCELTSRHPMTASFGGAVKWLWQQPQTDWFFHMEDDWVLTQPIRHSHLQRELLLADEDVTQLRLSPWSWRRQLRQPPEFCTGPSFLRTDDAFTIATLMDPDLDPEKQMLNDTNPPLRELLKLHRPRYYGTILTSPMITDIGREWREARRIEKKVVAGRSEWTQQGA